MATATTTSSGNWSGSIWSGGSGSGGAPADGDAVVISAGHSVLMDSDLSGWTGLTTLTITGHNTGTPGMLYFKDGTSGYLKFRTGTNYGILGTNNTNRGRLLANSDGVWGNTGALSQSYKAVIQFDGTSYLNARYLDIALYATHPTTKYVRTYGSMKTVSSINTSTDTITMSAAHGWSVGTAVMVRSSGDMPGGLEEDFTYFVLSPSGADLKLAATYNGPTVDITSSGSGTIEIYDGHTNTSTGTMNVLDDVSGDIWTTTSGHNIVSLIDTYHGGNQNSDVQRNVTISSISSSQITLGSNVDSAQSPGARIYYCSRNVSLRWSNTSGYGIYDPTNSVFDCECRNTAATASSPYMSLFCAANGDCTGNTFSGVYCNFFYFQNGRNKYNYYSNTYSSSLLLIANMYACGGSVEETVNGHFAGHNCSLRCTRTTFANSFFATDRTVNGRCIDCTVTGEVRNSYSACSGIGTRITSTVKSGFALFVEAHNCTYSGTATGMLYVGYGVDAYPVNNCVVTGTVTGVRYLSYLYNSSWPPYTDITFRNAVVAFDSVVLTSGTAGYSMMRFENYNRTGGSDRVYSNGTTILRLACDGTGDAPSQDPDGGNGDCIAATSVYASCSSLLPATMLKGMRIWLSAAEHTVTFKVQTTYAGISAGNLKLTCNYIGADGVITETTDAPAISQRSNAADWSQTLAVTFTQTMEGWATFDVDLMEYESGNEVYIWPAPVIT